MHHGPGQAALPRRPVGHAPRPRGGAGGECGTRPAPAAIPVRPGAGRAVRDHVSRALGLGAVAGAPLGAAGRGGREPPGAVAARRRLTAAALETAPPGRYPRDGPAPVTPNDPHDEPAPVRPGPRRVQPGRPPRPGPPPGGPPGRRAGQVRRGHLGHSTVELTIRVYYHLLPGFDDALAERL